MILDALESLVLTVCVVNCRLCISDGKKNFYLCCSVIIWSEARQTSEEVKFPA